MANSADPDQLASWTDLDLHCFQKQGISGFSRTRVNMDNENRPDTPAIGNGLAKRF